MRDFQGVSRLFSRQARDQSSQASPDQAFCMGRPFKREPLSVPGSCPHAVLPSFPGQHSALVGRTSRKRASQALARLQQFAPLNGACREPPIASLKQAGP